MNTLKTTNRESLRKEFERRYEIIKENIPIHYLAEVKKKAPYLSDARIINVRHNRCNDLFVLGIFEKLYKNKKQ